MDVLDTGKSFGLQAGLSKRRCRKYSFQAERMYGLGQLQSKGCLDATPLLRRVKEGLRPLCDVRIYVAISNGNK